MLRKKETHSFLLVLKSDLIRQFLASEDRYESHFFLPRYTQNLLKMAKLIYAYDINSLKISEILFPYRFFGFYPGTQLICGCHEFSSK